MSPNWHYINIEIYYQMHNIVYNHHHKINKKKRCGPLNKTTAQTIIKVPKCLKISFNTCKKCGCSNVVLCTQKVLRHQHKTYKMLGWCDVADDFLRAGDYWIEGTSYIQKKRRSHLSLSLEYKPIFFAQ